MTDVFVKPRPGLILAEVPAEGGRIPKALAEEWTANRMVVPAQPVATVRRHLGGLVRGPQPAIVGESGPETFIPIKRPPVKRRATKAAKSARKRRT